MNMVPRCMYKYEKQNIHTRKERDMEKIGIEFSISCLKYQVFLYLAQNTTTETILSHAMQLKRNYFLHL